MKTKIFIAIGLVLAVIAVAFAQSNKQSAAELPDEIKQLEMMAAGGDTAALHKLLRFYDDNSSVYVEVEEFILCDDTTGVEEDSVVPSTTESELEALYNSRLEYWLNKGLEMNDPVAIFIKGMQLYYTDEAQSIEYLSKAADSGNSQAALFCGSAYYNQGQPDKAIKYLTMAYEAGEPSAGWHLAMCLSMKEDADSRQKALEYLRQSALLDYPEAVQDMRRIEPFNKTWQQKADSLEIDFY